MPPLHFHVSVVRRCRYAALTSAALALAAPLRADIPVVELTGVVHAISAAHVTAAIDRAAAAKAPLVVLRLDTPGGLDTSMRQIIDAMLGAMDEAGGEIPYPHLPEARRSMAAEEFVLAAMSSASEAKEP